MPIDASIPLRVNQPTLMTPADMVSLQALSTQSKRGELAYQQEQRDYQESEKAREIFSQPGAIDEKTGGPSLETIKNLYSSAPKFAQLAQKAREDSAYRDSQRKQGDMQYLVNSQTVSDKNAANWGKAHENEWRMFVSSYDAAKGAGASEEEANRQANAAYMRTIDEDVAKGWLMGIAPSGIEEIKGRPRDIYMARGILKALNPADARAEVKSKLEEQSAGETPFIKEVQATLKAQGLEAGSDQYQKRFSAEMKKRLARETAPTATQISLYGEGKISDAALTLAAEQYLAGDRQAGIGYARSPQMKAMFQNKLAELAAARGLKGADLAAITAEYQGMQAGERTLGTRTANIEMAVTEAKNLAPLALAASDKVKRTQFPTINALILAGEKGTGDPNAVQLGIAVNSLINIYARAISPTGVPTVSDKDHARELLSGAWSKGQFRAGVEQLMKELAAAQRAPGAVREEMRSTISGRKAAPQGPAGPFSDPAKEQRYQDWKRNQK